MRTTDWLMTAILGLLMMGCAGISTAPTPEARQALAPTGKLLRVGGDEGSGVRSWKRVGPAPGGSV